jgi:hypothetical protein
VSGLAISGAYPLPTFAKGGRALRPQPHPPGVGFLADLLLVDGDPLADIKLLQRQDALLVIMKDGRLHKAPAAGPPHRGRHAFQKCRNGLTTMT